MLPPLLLLPGPGHGARDPENAPGAAAILVGEAETAAANLGIAGHTEQELLTPRGHRRKERVGHWPPRLKVHS
jgi:hypothetical protein